MRIALRAKDVSSPWKYLQLAGSALGRKARTRRCAWAEEGMWIFQDGHSDGRLALFAAELLQKQVAGLKRRLLSRASSSARQTSMSTFAGARSKRHGLRRGARVARAPASEPDAAFSSRPADLYVKILMHEGQFETGLGDERKYRVSQTVKEGLARASEADFPREALGVYAQRVDELANGGSNRAYEEAAGFVARMGRLRARAEQKV